jgi:hypothetical protein
LSPLTAFCGTNSSGKSTILKIFLLLRQSMGIKDNFSFEKGSLRFFGSEVDLGDFSSFVSNRDLSKRIEISLITEGKVPVNVVNDIKKQRGKEEFSLENDKSVSYNLCTRFSFGVIPENEGSSRAYLHEGFYSVQLENEVLAEWKIKYKSFYEDGEPKFDLIISKEFLDIDDRLNTLISEDEKELSVHAYFSGELIPIGMVIPDERKKEEIGAEEGGHYNLLPIPSLIYNISRNFIRSLNEIEYIGPLRSPAKRFYLTRSDVDISSDFQGESIPYVLKEIEHFKSRYISPNDFHKVVEEELFYAMTTWLHYIRTGKIMEDPRAERELSYKITEKHLIQINIKSPFGSNEYSLADSGFGYSQLLPIIIKGLLLKNGHTLIIEQPELHLNPSIQVRIAEFLVSLVYAGKNVIIETHSEHIINTIRIMVAEDELGSLDDKCNIFYIEIDEVNKKPVIHNLSIQKDGTVPKWPKEFFGEAAHLTARLLRIQGKRLLENKTKGD